MNKADLSISALVTSKIIKTSGALRSIEIGNSLIRKTEIEKIAKHLKVTVVQLLTGYDLEKYRVKSVARGNKGSIGYLGGSIMLPKVKVSEPNAFFERILMSPETVFLEGADIMTLVRKARAEGFESIDWSSEWLRMTRSGKDYEDKINQIVKVLKKVGDPLRIMILNEVVNQIWDEDKKEEPKE